MHAPRLECKRHAFVIGWPIAEVGGVSEVVRNLASELAASSDVAPVVIESCEPTAEVDSNAPVRLKPLSPCDEKRPLRALASFFLKFPAGVWRLRRLCRQFQIDVLNPHFVGPDYFTFALAKRLGFFRGQLVLSFHGSDVQTMVRTSGMERFVYRTMLGAADWLVPCSEGLGVPIRAFAPELSHRIRAIRNGINTDRFEAESNGDAELPEAFRGRPFLLNVGAFHERKGHDLLVRAFAEIRSAHPELRLVIAGGNGPEYERTEALARELGVEEYTLLLRNVPHARVAALLKAAQLFVLPSRREGFAMVLLEAAAARTPIVASLACGVGELLVDGEDGWTVPVERADLLADAIEDALANPEERLRRSLRLEERVLTEFTWARACSEYRMLYERPRPERAPLGPLSLGKPAEEKGG